MSEIRITLNGRSYPATISDKDAREIENCQLNVDSWKPKRDDCYYSVEDGDCTLHMWSDSDIDQARYDVGNCFPTSGACKAHIEYLKALTTLKRSSTYKPGNSTYHYVYRDHNKALRVGFHNMNVCADAVRFATHEEAQASIDKYAAEWRCVLGVENE